MTDNSPVRCISQAELDEAMAELCAVLPLFPEIDPRSHHYDPQLTDKVVAVLQSMPPDKNSAFQAIIEAEKIANRRGMS